jgi:hypothetical protein
MLRGFTDSTGVEWRVWEVFPTDGGLSSADAMTRSRLQETPFANGWLCFECPNEKRRLAPIPPGWEFRDFATLEQLCREAVPVSSRRPRPVASAPAAATPTSA